MKIEKYYKNMARELVDLIYDKGFIAEDCDRKSMRYLEEYIAFLFQSQITGAIRSHDLLKSIKGK
jgi:hypothetical protein